MAMSARKWKEMINLPNNSCFVKRERKDGERPRYIFDATPFSAESVLSSIQKEYTNNKVVMNKLSKHDTPYASYRYEIYRVLVKGVENGCSSV